MPGSETVSHADVVRAAAAIAGQVERTPSAHSRTLSAVLGCEVVVKFENLQFVAAFKERGALNKLLSLSEAERATGVVAMSAGNHAQAVAYHATRLGIAATVVMPATTPFVKVQRTQELGAHVVLRGDDLRESTAEAHRLEADEGLTFVHPYDDPLIIAGQGTVALEMLADHPDLEVLVAPCGGGGLLSGIAVAAAGVDPGVEVVGVQSERYAPLASALDGVERPVGGPTIAEGIAVKAPGVLTTELLRTHRTTVITASEEHIEEGVNLLLEIEKVVVEGAGAAGIAALMEHRERFAGRRVGVVLSGGNVDPRLLASIIMRALVRNGRLCRLEIEVPDVPGTLGRVSTIVGRAGANIVEIHHQRMFVDVSARSAELEVVVETLDHDHVDRVAAALKAEGYAVRVARFAFRP